MPLKAMIFCLWFALLTLIATTARAQQGATVTSAPVQGIKTENGKLEQPQPRVGPSPLLSEAEQPRPLDVLYPYLSAAKGLLSLEAPIRRKRLAMLSALSGKEHLLLASAGWHSDLIHSVNNITWQLKTLGEHMRCRQDPTLPTFFPLDGNYLFAANLRNCSALMPHWSYQLTKALLTHLVTRPYSPNPGLVMVSIYESGSTDTTAQYLAVLEVLLSALGIPTNIIANGTLRRGTQERIQFLAKVRNAAASPLYSHPDYPSGFPADRLIFSNDVWFCHGDILRLTQYQSADIACGLDVFRTKPKPKPQALRSLQTSWSDIEAAASKLHNSWESGGGIQISGHFQDSSEHSLHRVMYQTGNVGETLELGGRRQAIGEAWDSAAMAGEEGEEEGGKREEGHRDQDVNEVPSSSRRSLRPEGRLVFYDTWVARAIDGSRFENWFPVVTHPPSAKALASGLPFPVVCCWNGLLVMNAEPFRKHNIRFRNAVPDECRECEGSLMCDDFWRLGYQRALVDPNVRQMYEPWTNDALYDHFIGEHVPLRSWANLVQHHQHQNNFSTPFILTPPPPSPSSPPPSPSPETSTQQMGQAGAGVVLPVETQMPGGLRSMKGNRDKDGVWEGALCERGCVSGEGTGPSSSVVRTSIALEGDGSVFSDRNLGDRSRSDSNQSKGRRLTYKSDANYVGGQESGSTESQKEALLLSQKRRESNFGARQHHPASWPMEDIMARFWEGVTPPLTRTCCNKEVDSDLVYITKCSPMPFMLPNHTHTALLRQAQQG